MFYHLLIDFTINYGVISADKKLISSLIIHYSDIINMNIVDTIKSNKMLIFYHIQTSIND